MKFFIRLCRVKGVSPSPPSARRVPPRPAPCRLTVEGLEGRVLPASSINATALNDLGPGLYQGFPGGLYPNGSDTRPPALETAADTIAANQIKPLHARGNLDPAHGKIVMISVGMSNTYLEFAADSTNSFLPRADRDPSKNSRLVIVKGAQSGQPASAWVSPTSKVWSVVNQNLAAAGVTPAQVEVAWVKQAEAHPEDLGGFPSHAQVLQQDLESIARNLHLYYPNLKLAFYSSRIYCYTTSTTALNPEP